MAEAVRPRKEQKKHKSKSKSSIVVKQLQNEEEKIDKLITDSDLQDEFCKISLEENLIKTTETLKAQPKNVLPKIVESSKLDYNNLQKEITNIQTKPLSNDFKTLNKELNYMEPYLESTAQLNNLKNENDIIKQETCNAIPSAPAFHDPEILERSVIQRCIDRDHSEQLIQHSEVLTIEKSDIKPYSDIQLAALYENLELEEKEESIKEFLESEKKTSQSEFYEIVMNYLRAQTNLIGTVKDIKKMESEHKKLKERSWTFEDRISSEEGNCEDDQLLTVNFKHSIATHQPEIATHLAKQLKQVREAVFDIHSLHIYVSEMSKLQVENYLQNVTTSSTAFLNLPKNSPVQCYLSEPNSSIEENKKQLKECISVLFSFCRRNIKDAKFKRDLRNWLSDLIALLLRVSTIKDHIFILNHLIRCPAGTGEWASHFIQITAPSVGHTQHILGSVMLDHLVTVLAILLQPIQERKKFLHHFNANMETKMEEDTSWIVIDSSGEDEEDSTEMWHYFKENDIIQFLNQIPFENLFKHILLIDNSIEETGYDLSKVTPQSMMKLFSFTTLLLKIFQDGLKTYYQARYKGVIKRLCRLVRHTVNYVSDHWQNFANYCQSSSSPFSNDLAMIARLQVQYDQFFETAVKTVFLSPRRGAWQFLAVIPYKCVSLHRLSKIAYKLHVGYREELNCKEDEDQDWLSSLSLDDTLGRFQDQLLKMGESETFYILTAMANMATVRGSREKEFIDTIISNLFEVTFVNLDTRDALNRTGRDLFLTITSVHPFTVSTLLMQVQEKLEKVGSLSLYLFRFLFLDTWIPTEEDLQCLSYWLLYTPPSSLESQLSRVVLSKMNWDFDSKGENLFLPKSIHERVALIVVEVGLKVSTKLGQGNLLSEGVKQVTSAVYSSSQEQICFNWCWSMLNQLHLHLFDQPHKDVCELMSKPHLMLREIGDPSTCPSLGILKKGISSKHPLGIFATLLMSSWGHSVPEICNHCPESLEQLVSSGYCEYALSVLHVATPLFFNQPEELWSDTKFISAIQNLIIADQTYVSIAKSYIVADQIGNITKLFAALIIEQLVNHRRYNLDDASPVMTLWINILTTIPNWRTNSNVLRILDSICRFSLFDPNCWHRLQELFKEQRKTLSGDASKSGLGSLLTWVSAGSSSSPRSLLAKSSAMEVPWFALAVLICEAQEEYTSGLWKRLLKELYGNPTGTLDNALKNTCSALEIDAVASNSLSIYRLGQQLIDLPIDHPAFPPTAHVFFILHLSRTPPEPGQYDMSSAINKLYEGYVNGNFLKKIKSKFKEVSRYFETKKSEGLNQSDVDEDSFVTLGFEDDLMTAVNSSSNRQEFLTQLCELLQAMSDWMEEPRLYETGLYLPALDPRLLPQKLNLIFQESWDLWAEYCDLEYISTCTSEQLKSWKNHRCFKMSAVTPCSPSTPTHSDSLRRDDTNLNPTSAIFKRLKEYDLPLPPPQVPTVRQKKSPIKMANNLDRDSVLYDIDRYTSLVIENAHTMMLNSKEMCALDCVFIELLPRLWTNNTSKKVLHAKCEPNRNSKYKECSGPANIVVEFTEKQLNEGIKARLEENRHQREHIFNSSMNTPPLQLCEAAVHLDALVSHVVYWHKRFLKTGNKDQVSSIVNYGRELFYQLVQLTSDETSSFPPAKQLISTCTDVLGQEFLRGHVDCQEALVVQVLHSTQSLGVFLSPHFTPVVTSIQTFIKLYDSITPHVPAQPDVCFMLLSKFEMENWLKTIKVNYNERNQLIKTVGAALSSVLTLEEKSTVMCLEIYRVHLRALLCENVAAHFSEVLTLLLDISLTTTKDCGNVASNIWYDLFNLLAHNVTQFSPQMNVSQEISAIRTYSQMQTLLEPQMVKDILGQLSTHFIHYRLQFGLYGLYPKYKLFMKPLSILLGMMSHLYIVTANATARTADSNALCQEIWRDLEGLWASWIAPLGGKARDSCPQWIQELTSHKRVLLPWTPGDSSAPAIAVGMYGSTIAFFHETFIGYNVLSMYLEYYMNTYANSEVKDHVLSVIHSQMNVLPWHHLNPTIKDVEIFSKIINEYLPECHNFIGTIFIQIAWNKVVKQFDDRCLSASNSFDASSDVDSPRSNNSTPRVDGNKSPNSAMVKLHILLLNILVRISMEPSVRQSGLLHPLLMTAESFHWRLVDAKNFESILNWFVMSCDPRIVLNMHNRNPIDINVIRLLHVSAGYTRDTPANSHRSGSLKRRLLVRALCRLLITAATRHKALLSARKSLFAESFAILLTQMEDTVAEVISEEHQFTEGQGLSAEPMCLIGGGASTPLLQEVCRDSLLSWLKGTHPSRAFLMPLLASISKGILQLHHRSPLIEQTILSLFENADSFSGGCELTWGEIVGNLSFPLTNPMPLLTEAAQGNHLLLIFAHARWRLLKASSSDRSFILSNLVEILSMINPNVSCEKGLLLIIGECIMLVEDQLTTAPEQNDKYSVIWRHCKSLCSLLSCWGEDRASQGLLAVIGLGRKSSLSTKTRLICKCLHAFWSSQLLSPGLFSSINEHNKSLAEIDLSSDLDDDEESLKSIRHLVSLRSSAIYSEYKCAFDFAIDFIQDGRHSILETEQLLRPLILKLFPSELQLKYLYPTTGISQPPPEVEHYSSHQRGAFSVSFSTRSKSTESNCETIAEELESNDAGLVTPSAPPPDDI